MRDGERKSERGTTMHSAIHCNGTAVEFENPFGNGQPQADPACSILTTLSSTVEALEDIRELLRQNPIASILHLDGNAVALLRESHGNGPARRGILQGILEEIVQYALDESNIGPDKRQVVGQLRLELLLFLLGQELKFLHHILDKFRQRERLGVHLGLMGVEFRQLKQLGNQFPESCAVSHGDIKIVPPLLWCELVVFEGQGFEIPMQRCQWRTEIV